uniref:Uncharacterized protein n=1 Tax=Tetradesmus obliquus TaxID=3088 RepID=A0A383V5P4_TETOB|eukprot:jgi/Sobl393_1/314/SZX60102.1
MFGVQAGAGSTANRAAGVQQLGSIQLFELQVSQSMSKLPLYYTTSGQLSNATRVLQQLREAIGTAGVYASLPTTASSFEPATSQTLFNSSFPSPPAPISNSTLDASLCPAGQVQYAPPPAAGPCYLCDPGTQNPVPGGTCQKCSIAYTEPDQWQRGCMCAAGWSPPELSCDWEAAAVCAR